MTLHQTPYIDACKDFEALYNRVISTREPVEITREGSESVSVILTSELESLLETVYLFQSR